MRFTFDGDPFGAVGSSVEELNRLTAVSSRRSWRAPEWVDCGAGRVSRWARRLFSTLPRASRGLLTWLVAVPAIGLCVGSAGAQLPADDVVQSSAATSPILWPESQRAFWMDGAGLLVPLEQRAAVLAMSAGKRAEWIEEFRKDPLPATDDNELALAIERRQRLALATMGPQFTLLDARARILFLHGIPQAREIVDCEHVFRPLEIWSFARPGASDPDERKQQDHLLLYQPRPGQPYRLWRPSDGKRPLYTDEMEYWLDQYHELQAYITGRRFDLQLCKNSRDVDRISGIGGLILYKQDRPRDEEILPWLEPPGDLAAWARQALETPAIEDQLVLQPRLVAVRYPETSGQRILARVTVALPRDERLETIEESPGEPEHRLQIAALAERYGGAEQSTREPGADAEPSGELFEEWLVRYRIPVLRNLIEPGAEEDPTVVALSEAGEASVAPTGRDQDLTTTEPAGPTSSAVEAAPEELELGLVLERSFRAEEIFQLRLWVRDEVSGATGVLVAALDVPREPVRAAEPSLADLVLARGEQMVELSIPGADGIVLVPPETDVVLGLWRAEALVSGANIEAVRFLVDGQQQFRRRGQPYSTELRLAKYPREQVIRVEGLDADGAVVAADELVINQQRGELRVRIVEPSRGASASGTVVTRAEVVVPEERRVKQVEFAVNNELQKTVAQAPWETEVEVPAALSGNDLTFLTVVAELDDGARAEDVRFLNMPDDLERLNVDYVELYTSVSDRSNRPVEGLGPESFEVYEDGRRQEIAKFELVEDLPITVGITIDTSGSMTRSLGEARRAAVEFLQRVVTARDRSFAVGFADRPNLIMPRTSDVVAVSRALSGVRANGNTALYDAVVTSLYYFRGVRGRRALILLSDGEDTASSIPYKDAREYAQRSGVAIYAIGLNIGRLQIDVRNKLNELAGDTGGRSFFISNADELRDVYGEIERELRSQYLVAYASDRPEATEEFRTVEIKMVGPGRGTRARTVSGYYP